MNELLSEFQGIQQAMHHTWPTAALIIAVLWAIQGLNHALDYRLCQLGISPGLC